MEQFDARAVMAARIAEECGPDGAVEHVVQPTVDQRDEPSAADPPPVVGRPSPVKRAATAST
jgi:hypothetical protein